MCPTGRYVLIVFLCSGLTLCFTFWHLCLSLSTGLAAFYDVLYYTGRQERLQLEALHTQQLRSHVNATIK